MEKMTEALLEEARRLPLPEQLNLIEKLARSIHAELEGEAKLREELAAWDALSDQTFENLESNL